MKELVDCPACDGGREPPKYNCETCGGSGVVEYKPKQSISRQIGVLPNGCTLYVQDNEAGGRTYFSDEIGGGVMVWDTCLVNESTLISAIAKEHELEMVEKHKKRIASKLLHDNAALVSTGYEMHDIEAAQKEIDDAFEQAYRTKEAALTKKHGS